MFFHKMNLLVLVCLYWTLASTSQSHDRIRSVKKDKLFVVNPSVVDFANGSQITNFTNSMNYSSVDSITRINTRVLYKNDESGIPESIRAGFYLFIGLSILSVVFILLRIYRMRLTRAERKYGVQGDRITQELTPLPMAIEDESDTEDHTLFDINRQVRVS